MVANRGRHDVMIGVTSHSKFEECSLRRHFRIHIFLHLVLALEMDCTSTSNSLKGDIPERCAHHVARLIEDEN